MNPPLLYLKPMVLPSFHHFLISKGLMGFSANCAFIVTRALDCQGAHS